VKVSGRGRKLQTAPSQASSARDSRISEHNGITSSMNSQTLPETCVFGTYENGMTAGAPCHHRRDTRSRRARSGTCRRASRSARGTTVSRLSASAISGTVFSHGLRPASLSPDWLCGSGSTGHAEIEISLSYCHPLRGYPFTNGHYRYNRSVDVLLHL
jgi:hypothetical protein